MRQADYPHAETAFGEAIAALRESGGEPRELFELLQKLGLARSHQGADERALEAFDEALAVAAAIGPAFSPAAYVHIARAESLRRLGRRADAEESLRAAIAAAEHAPPEARDRIALAARRALDALRPRPAARRPPPRPAARRRPRPRRPAPARPRRACTPTSAATTPSSPSSTRSSASRPSRPRCAGSPSCCGSRRCAGRRA